MEEKTINLTVNGRKHELKITPNTTLLRALRDQLGYTEVKNGCESGDCGACTVIMDGKAVNSCMVLIWQADGSEIVTVTGLGDANHPHPIQQAFADSGASQCGFCTPGMVMSTYTLLEENPHPNEDEIRMALSGNLCRCTGYGHIVQAVQQAAEEMSSSGGQK
ncbi:MAG: (2Fe-2S)-binding protein [Anaerolineaceae bacterium]|nr:(2Fe-2S)-binding protein [Anaerolineaceae bacterium]